MAKKIRKYTIYGHPGLLYNKSMGGDNTWTVRARSIRQAYWLVSEEQWMTEEGGIGIVLRTHPNEAPRDHDYWEDHNE